MSGVTPSTSSLPTPFYRLTKQQAETVYDPAEDTFLLMDAIEQDIEEICARLPRVVLEVGVGSGVVSALVAKALSDRGVHTLSLGTDVNPDACEAARCTATMNGVNVDVIRSDLASALMPRLAGTVDLLLFNPPYVPTEEEPASNLERCWAGGVGGVSTLGRLLPSVPALLSPRGVFYLVALRENDIPALLSHNEKLLKGSIVLERRAGIEYLYILKFERI